MSTPKHAVALACHGADTPPAEATSINQTQLLHHLRDCTILTMTYTLHSWKINKNAYKSQIAAKYAGITVDLAEVELGKGNKTPEFLKWNPNGKVHSVSLRHTYSQGADRPI